MDFTVTKNGTALVIELQRELTTAIAPELIKELGKYKGQGVQKVVFDASQLIFLSSSGIRAVIYAKLSLGNNPEIVFVNCAKEIYDTLKLVGLTSSIKFVKVAGKKLVRRQDVLEGFASNNDVVCYTMKMGGND